jgi:hypothetical protein
MKKIQIKRQQYLHFMLVKADLEFDERKICKKTVLRMSRIYDDLKNSIPEGISSSTIEYGKLLCRLMVEQRKHYYLCGIRDSKSRLKGIARKMLQL